jgi:hypothetical protein
MTIEEIASRLPNLPIRETAENYGDHTLRTMECHYRNGFIPSSVWEAYCYLWRNLSPRISNELRGYELENS